MTEPLLSVDDLAAGYLHEPVFKGVSFTLVPGEIVTVIGANGAGKTTLLKALCGLAPPRSGRVLLDGTDVVGERTEAIARKGLLLSPEGRRLFTHLTVAENLEAGRFTGRGGSSVEEVCGLFPPLRSRLQSKAGTLSGGEQQMLAVARALIGGPRVLLVDEPSLGLAPLMVSTVFDSLRRVASSGQAILVCEQNVAEATRIADRCLILADGSIAFAGPCGSEAEIREIQTAYASLLSMDSSS